MVKRMVLFCTFVVIFGNSALAGVFYGFGVGYTARNVYEDNMGAEEEESTVPLLGLNGGYRLKASMVQFFAGAQLEFFAMDILRGNREYILFADPHAFLSVPLKLGDFAISPVVGYGGMHRMRYIDEATYLSGEDRYINAADFSESMMDILYGGEIFYGDWFSSSFIITRDIESLSTLSVCIRTPHSQKSVPFICIAYREGEELRTFGIGLTFYR